MSRYNLIYYVTMVTGIVVLLVGIQNLYTFWGEVTFAGIVGQATGWICLLGGFVNLLVARKFNLLVAQIKKIKEPEYVD